MASKEPLNELFSLTNNDIVSGINSVDYNNDSELPVEQWDWFLNILTESINSNTEEWKSFFYDTKLSILAYKYFTRQKLVSTDELEHELRYRLKAYFIALQSFTDYSEILDKVKKMPSEMVFFIVRYCFHLSEDLDEVVEIDSDKLKKRIKELKNERKKFGEELGLISKKYQDVFDMDKFLLLYNNGLLFEDNYLNRAICEFMVKLLNDAEVCKMLNSKYSKAIINDLKFKLPNLPSYSNFLTNLKLKTVSECFTKKGDQIGARLDNILQQINEVDYTGYVVDVNSRFKEPYDVVNNNINNKIQQTVEDDTKKSPVKMTSGNSSGASFSNSADIDVPDMGGFGSEIPEEDIEPNNNNNELPEEFGEEEQEEQNS